MFCSCSLNAALSQNPGQTEGQNLPAIGKNNGKSLGQKAGPAPTTFKLTGGISHSEKLAPMPQNERIGALDGDTTDSDNSGHLPAPAISQPAINQHGNGNQQQGFLPTQRYVQQSSTKPSIIPQLNPIYAKPHVDAYQGVYKARLHQLAEQNAMATRSSRRNQKVQIKVPLWLAGQWQRMETEEISRRDLSSGKILKPVGKQSAVVTDNFGLFKDRRGNVFMVVPLNAIGAIDRGFAMDYHQVKKYELILLAKNAALVKVQASHRVVSKKDRRVVAAYQDEELTRYTLVRDGLVKNDSSVKVFDQMGEPKLITRALSVERRVKRI